MRWSSSVSLLIKLPLIFSLIVIGVASTIGLAMVEIDRQRLTDRLHEKALLLARSVAVTSPEPVLRGDSWSLYKTLRQILQNPDGTRDAAIIAAMVIDPKGRILAHSDPAAFPIGQSILSMSESGPADWSTILDLSVATTKGDGDTVVGLVPILANGTTIGIVHLRLSTEDVRRAIAEGRKILLLLSIGMALVGVVAGLAWSIATLRPLKALARSMEALGRGHQARLEVNRSDEIGALVGQFNRMASEIAEKRRLARELAANEKVIALGRIAAGVAHEVNNPLAGMLNCLSTLHAHGNDPALVERYLPLIEHGLRQIEALVKDLLIELRVEDAKVLAGATALDDVRTLVEAEIDRGLVTLLWHNELPPQEPVNALKLQQILLNLLRNALQAMPDGGTLTCRLTPEQDQLLFAVEDTGHGISAEDLPHIFDPFFSRRTTGTGLGLWIVLRLVQSLKGTIDVESAPGTGARFRVRIPRESGDGA